MPAVGRHARFAGDPEPPGPFRRRPQSHARPRAELRRGRFTVRDSRIVVGRIVDDYLPAALETYANLPRSFAMRHRAEGRRTAHEELLHQLGIIETQIEQIATAIYAGDAESLAARSRFLEDRFADSSLRLPPRP